MQISHVADAPPSVESDSRAGEARAWRSQTQVELVVHWVRQERIDSLGSSTGVRIPLLEPIELHVEKNSGQSTVRVSAIPAADPSPPPVEALVSLLVNGDRVEGSDLVAAVRSWEAWCALPGAKRKEAVRLFGKAGGEEAHRRLERRLEPLRELSRRILRAVAPALEKHYSALLADDSTPDVTGQGEDLVVEPVTMLGLRLPLLNNRKWHHRVSALAACDVQVDQQGLIDVRPTGQSEYDQKLQTILAAGAALNPVNHSPCAPFNLSFTDVRIVPRGRLMPCLKPILACFGGPPADQLAELAATEGDDAEVTIKVSVREEAARPWIQLHRERTMDHHNAIRAVAWRVQKCLRAWMWYIYFSKPEFIPGRDSAYSALVYCCTRPCHHRTGPDFTYDPMNPVSVSRACRHVTKAVSELLGPLRAALAASGYTDEALQFRMRMMPKILDAARFRYQLFLKLIQADALAVDRFIKLGNLLRALRPDSAEEPPEKAPDLLKDIDAVDKNHRIRFRRLDSREDLSPLGSLLMVEASAALSAHYGNPYPVDLLVRIRSTQASSGAAEIVLKRRFLPPAADPV